MSGHTIEGMARQVGGEWEKLILAGTMVLLAMLGYQAWERISALWQAEPRLGTAGNPVSELFTPGAWAFLGDAPAGNLPGDHAFTLQIPGDWQRPVAPRPAERPRTERPDNWRDVVNRMRTAREETTRPTPQPQPQPQPRQPQPQPQPQPRPEPDTFVAFTGFIALEDGQPSAYLIRRKGSQRQAGYLQVGQKIGTYEVIGITPDEVVLGSPAGEELRLNLNQQQKANDL